MTRFGLCKCHCCVHQRASDSWRRSWGKCSASHALVCYHSWRPSPATSHHPPKMPGWGGMFPSVDRPGWPAAWLGVVNFCPTAAPLRWLREMTWATLNRKPSTSKGYGCLSKAIHQAPKKPDRGVRARPKKKKEVWIWTWMSRRWQCRHGMEPSCLAPSWAVVHRPLLASFSLSHSPQGAWLRAHILVPTGDTEQPHSRVADGPKEPRPQKLSRDDPSRSGCLSLGPAWASAAGERGPNRRYPEGIPARSSC